MLQGICSSPTTGRIAFARFRLRASLRPLPVSFNGIPGPMIYTSFAQVAVAVPYGITGTVAQITVSYQGSASDAFSVSVAPSAPSIFSLNGTGAGQAAAVNADGSLNDAAHPIKTGGYLSLYVTGEGQTMPQGADGKVAPNAPPVPTTSTECQRLDRRSNRECDLRGRRARGDRRTNAGRCSGSLWCAAGRLRSRRTANRRSFHGGRRSLDSRLWPKQSELTVGPRRFVSGRTTYLSRLGAPYFTDVGHYRQQLKLARASEPTRRLSS